MAGSQPGRNPVDGLAECDRPECIEKRDYSEESKEIQETDPRRTK